MVKERKGRGEERGREGEKKGKEGERRRVKRVEEESRGSRLGGKKKEKKESEQVLTL